MMDAFLLLVFYKRLEPWLGRKLSASVEENKLLEVYSNCWTVTTKHYYLLSIDGVKCFISDYECVVEEERMEEEDWVVEVERRLRINSVP